MKTVGIARHVVWEDSIAYVLARIVGGSGLPILQADVSAIACTVYDDHAADPTAAIVSLTVAVVSAVYDTLQTGDVRWTEDATGFNFLHKLPAAAFPTGGHTYRVEYRFTMANGDSFPVVVELTAQAIRSS